MSSARRRSLRLVIVTVLAGLLVALLVTPASAAPAVSYRFWGFFQSTDGAWAFALSAAGAAGLTTTRRPGQAVSISISSTIVPSVSRYSGTPRRARPTAPAMASGSHNMGSSPG